jgi:hypothetical protein
MGTTTATSPGISASSLAMGTCMDHCRWLPVAAAQDASGGVAEAPVAVAGWNEDAREHMVAVLDLRLSRETHQLVQSGPSLRPRQLGVLDGRATDLAVAKIDDIIVAVTATSAGSLALLLMHLPPVPGATTADLEVRRAGVVVRAVTHNGATAVAVVAAVAHTEKVPADMDRSAQHRTQFLVDSSNRADDGGPLAVLHHLPQLHRSAAASVDINSTQQVRAARGITLRGPPCRHTLLAVCCCCCCCWMTPRVPACLLPCRAAPQRLLSVSGDGSIAIVPLEAMQHALGAPGSAFKAPNGWGGYSQARWVDSSTFATAGVPGGLQVWDQRVRAQPVLRSPSSWGHTGCGALDAQQGPARQVRAGAMDVGGDGACCKWVHVVRWSPRGVVRCCCCCAAARCCCAQLLSLAVHPSRPNLAATGSTGGAVAVWDLRFASAPAAFTGAASSSGRDKAGSGDVWRVRGAQCLWCSAVYVCRQGADRGAGVPSRCDCLPSPPCCACCLCAACAVHV